MWRRVVFVVVVLMFMTACLAIDGFAQEKKKFKVAFALLSTIHDLGWTTAHYEGIEYLKKEMGDQITVEYTENVLAADTERVVRNYAKNGSDIIF